ncbi:CC/Se motif family (seleno)protein [Halomonas sp. NPDC076908]|uniref:CC/Se motif family (seleno)protein n=1 Tax=Halomonas sp. NPDC076908 TaxID=3390567 RepID=UPI003D00B952
MGSVIDIDNNALAFIKENGGAITVRLSPRHGCCGGSTNITVAEAHQPDNAKQFQRYVQNDVTVYIVQSSSTLAYVSV